MVSHKSIENFLLFWHHIFTRKSIKGDYTFLESNYRVHYLYIFCAWWCRDMLRMPWHLFWQIMWGHHILLITYGKWCVFMYSSFLSSSDDVIIPLFPLTTSKSWEQLGYTAHPKNYAHACALSWLGGSILSICVGSCSGGVRMKWRVWIKGWHESNVWLILPKQTQTKTQTYFTEYILQFCSHNNGENSGMTMTLEWKITPNGEMIWNVYSERRRTYNLNIFANYSESDINKNL